MTHPTSEKKNITAYFYHTQDIQYILGKYAQHEFPSHFLYGALHLGDEGVNVLWHKCIDNRKPRWQKMVYTLWRILWEYRRFDVVYATHYVGIEPVVFLRALGLFRKPIVIWHHQPVIKPKSKLRDWLGRFFYKGIDRMFFFSEKLINDSKATGKVPESKMVLGHWGPDLDFYDSIMCEGCERHGYISTGKERRDVPTMIKAFNNTGAQLDVYINRANGELNYEQIISSMTVKPNVKVHFFSGLLPADLAREVNKAKCVVVCCRETKYTVGLTTVVEALALGLPIICSRNPQMPFDFDADGIGISVPYYDEQAWEEAIHYMENHPDEANEMGRKARKLAERLYNDRNNAKEVASILKEAVFLH